MRNLGKLEQQDSAIVTINGWGLRCSAEALPGVLELVEREDAFRWV